MIVLRILIQCYNETIIQSTFPAFQGRILKLYFRTILFSFYEYIHVP